MVLTNAERQARYRERLKAAAAAAQMSEEKVTLLRDFRRRIVEARRQVEMLRGGAITMSERTASGWRDITGEAIQRGEQEVAEYERLLELYDPDGATDLAPDDDAG